MKTRDDFVSDEEFHVYHWLVEAEDNGLIQGIVCQPGPFELAPRASVKVIKQLKTKIKKVDKFLLNPHSYTPDFSFRIMHGSLSCIFKHSMEWVDIEDGVWEEVVIDVKGIFNRFGGSRELSINQKWMFQRFGIYVEKIVPEKLFKRTWVPEICRCTPKTGKLVKKYIGVPVVKEFMQDTKEKL